MILEFIWLFTVFIITWVAGFTLHELMHKFECERQGGKGKIEIWFHNHIPSMRCQCSGATNYSLFALAGGLYSGIILTIISYPLLSIYPPLGISLFLIGLVNLGYSIYEWRFLYNWNRDKYMYYKNVVYGIMLVLGLIIMRNDIWNYIRQ